MLRVIHFLYFAALDPFQLNMGTLHRRIARVIKMVTACSSAFALSRDITVCRLVAFNILLLEAIFG